VNNRFKYVLFVFVCLGWFLAAGAQKQNSVYGIPVTPEQAEGYPVLHVVILLHRDGRAALTDSLETAAFYRAFGLRPSVSFRKDQMDLAIRRILQEPDIRAARCELFTTEFSSPVTIVVHVDFLKPGEAKIVEGRKGMAPSRSLREFPLIVETDRAKLTFILNGAVGAYHEENAFFSKGPEFTKGNPVATNPAVKGNRFWGEFNLEPGIAGISQLGRTRLFPYAAVSYMITGRNASDIYTNGGALYGAFERLYAGILIPRIGKNKDINIDLSAGRQFFQLNDGFLIARFSGSANAGERASVYLNSRTTFQMTGLMKIHKGKFSLDGFYLEPQELFKDRQTNTRYLGGTLNYNNNKNLDAGISYISVPYSAASYSTPQGNRAKRGMYIINPKLWLTDMAGTGIFLKSEYAFQSHTSEDMRSNAWYIGAGIRKKDWKFRPSLYYRYAYMKGDDSTTQRYERFDPVLTGGLGNWVQGINFRKLVGSGNIISHRVELKTNLSKVFELTLDYFFLQADSYSNIGGLAPISRLKAKNFGQEVTLGTRYFLNDHFMLLTVFSWAKPGEAIEQAFDEPVYNWLSLQASLFMFF
jgi:hypothetical protein